MKFFNTITQALFLALPIAIKASPINIKLAKRACPDQTTISAWVTANGGVGANTVFYTGFDEDADFDVVGAFAAQVGGAWYESAVPQSQIDIWEADCTDDEFLANVVPTRVSTAISQLAVGNTYVMLGSNAIGAQSMWSTAEYPILAANGRSIVAVNAANSAQMKPYVHAQNPWAV